MFSDMKHRATSLLQLSFSCFIDVSNNHKMALLFGPHCRLSGSRRWSDVFRRQWLSLRYHWTTLAARLTRTSVLLVLSLNTAAFIVLFIMKIVHGVPKKIENCLHCRSRTPECLWWGLGFLRKFLFVKWPENVLDLRGWEWCYCQGSKSVFGPVWPRFCIFCI